MNCRFAHHSQHAGIALVIVMISIFVLTMLAAGFAYSMKVETRLAMHASNETELQWLGRSGVEYCKWILALQRACPLERYDALTQIWAGGPGGGPCSSNGPLSEVQQEVRLGHGYFTWKITDLERHWSINSPEPRLQQILPNALNLMGVDASQQTPIVNAILDWLDDNTQQRLEGAESDYYQSLRPSYRAKNGPMDDISELLLIRGITPEMFSVSNRPTGNFKMRASLFRPPEMGAAYTVGFAELFSTMASGQLNINTGSAEALQCIPGVNETVAQAIVAARGGDNDGSGMTGPFINKDPMYLFNRVPGLSLELARVISQFVEVQSRTFEVEITAHVGPSTRVFRATVLREPNGSGVFTLNFTWQI